MSHPLPETGPRKGLRWWPALAVLLLAGGAIAWLRLRPDWSFQQRNLWTLGVGLCAGLLLLLWWLTLSRARWKTRLTVAAAAVAVVGAAASMFRIRGVSGDLLPILEPRWARHGPARAPNRDGGAPSPLAAAAALDFPQFLGPDRTAQLAGPVLEHDWSARPPQVLWRQPIGAAWSGWAVVGSRALTQEQRGQEECVTCYDALTGRLLWSHADPARYYTTLAGEGPRCTPTVVSNRVFTLGATGILNCLDLATGRRLWSRDLVSDARSQVPQWGFAGSPLVFEGKVVVSAGGTEGRSLLAYRADTGEIAWSGGDKPASYGSPFLATLAGVRQILIFNAREIAAHDAGSGRVLWEYRWGVGQPNVAVPVVVGANRVVFSSGYGVGSELLEINPSADGHLAASRVWQSRKMKAKFANLFQREGFLYGLDDGILACLDLKDGAQRWKEGRYGHGQGLLVRDRLLLMAENGELVLLQPTPDSPHELSRFRVFKAKTWNPIALAGSLLLTRNDQEAACLRVPVETQAARGSNPKPPQPPTASER